MQTLTEMLDKPIDFTAKTLNVLVHPAWDTFFERKRELPNHKRGIFLDSVDELILRIGHRSLAMDSYSDFQFATDDVPQHPLRFKKTNAYLDAIAAIFQAYNIVREHEYIRYLAQGKLPCLVVLPEGGFKKSHSPEQFEEYLDDLIGNSPHFFSIESISYNYGHFQIGGLEHVRAILSKLKTRNVMLFGGDINQCLDHAETDLRAEGLDITLLTDVSASQYNAIGSVQQGSMDKTPLEKIDYGCFKETMKQILLNPVDLKVYSQALGKTPQEQLGIFEQQQQILDLLLRIKNIFAYRHKNIGNSNFRYTLTA